MAVSLLRVGFLGRRLFPLSFSAIHSGNSLQQATTSKPTLSHWPGFRAILSEKTGVTGAGTLATGVVAVLLSKELYIINSETLLALVMGGVIWYGIKKVGKPVGAYLDQCSQDVLDLFNNGKNSRMNLLRDKITKEESVAEIVPKTSVMFDVRRENEVMSREEEYRRRLHEVSEALKRRLEYQLEMESLEKQFQQQHIVSWIHDAVREALKTNPDDSIPRCISSLKQMAGSH